MTPTERDYYIRTLIGEARGEPFLGKVGVAHVIKNRVNAGGYGEGIQGVVLRPRQFEPWTTRRDELMGYDENTPGWKEAAEIVDGVMSGQIPDPTNGATHFANINTVRERGDKAGRPGGWIDKMENVSQYGRHTFGNADAGRFPPRALTAENQRGVPTAGGHMPPLAALETQAAAERAKLPGAPRPPSALAAINSGEADVTPGPGFVAGAPAPVPPEPDPRGPTIEDLLKQEEGITGAQAKTFMQQRGLPAAAVMGKAFLDQRQKDQQQARAPQVEPIAAPRVNTPDLSLLAMLAPKRKKRPNV